MVPTITVYLNLWIIVKSTFFCGRHIKKNCKKKDLEIDRKYPFDAIEHTFLMKVFKSVNLFKLFI